MKAIIQVILLGLLCVMSYSFYNKHIKYTQKTLIKALELSKKFTESNDLYSIKYPESWIYSTPEEYSVIFSGPKESNSFFTLVKIDVLTLKDMNMGSNFLRVSDLVNDLMGELGHHGKTLSFGNIVLPSNPNFKGMSVTMEYHYNGKDYKKIQRIIEGYTPSNKYYLWDYTAVKEYYELSLPIAEAMYDSWIINKFNKF